MSKRSTTIALGALLLAYLAWGAVYIERTSFLFGGERVFTLWDDGMISMTYARNLALGHGLVWNPGEAPVQGYSNLGVTLLMAALHLLRLSRERVALACQLLNLAVLAGILLLSWRIARRQLQADRPEALASVLAVALCAPLGLWSLQGADAGFIALWLLLSLLLTAGTGNEPGAATRFWIAALGIPLRSDAFVFYLALLGASLLWRGDVRGRLLHGGAALLVFWGGTLLFSRLYYGDALPNTYYLKTTGMPRDLMLTRGFTQLGYWLPGLVALGFAGFAGSCLRRSRALSQMAALIAVGIFYHVWVGGDWARRYGGRHLVPILPPLLLLSTAGVQLSLARLRTAALGASARTLLMFAGTAVVALLLDPVATAREWFDPRVPTLLQHYNVKNYRFARYLRDYTDPTTSVAVHWAGIIPYFSGRPAIDVLGKSDRHIARLRVDDFRPGHAKWDWDYVVDERRPDILDATSRGLEHRGDLLDHYTRIATRQPGFDGVSFYLRRDAVAKLSDTRVVRSPAIVGAPPAPDAPAAGSPGRG